MKEYVEESKPVFSVGEYWDNCTYNTSDYRLDYNQGISLWYAIEFKLANRVSTEPNKLNKLKSLIFSMKSILRSSSFFYNLFQQSVS